MLPVRRGVLYEVRSGFRGIHGGQAVHPMLRSNTIQLSISQKSEEAMSRKIGKESPAWKGGTYMEPRGYMTISHADHPRAMKNRRVYEHILAAEKAIGKSLPKGAVVHHVNENKSDNRNENLVICENTIYHHLLHARKRAYDATGNADSKKCCCCKQWDLPCNMRQLRTRQSVWYHRQCAANVMSKVNWNRKG